VRLLLDTHALLWYVGLPEKLTKNSAGAIRNSENLVLISAVSIWEIVIKSAAGKLKADIDLILSEMSSSGMRELPITIAHTMGVRDLPRHHGDPFDRILIAQALAEELTIVTADKVFSAYSVPVLTA